MPANRQTIPRAEREAEILSAAQAAFAEHGFLDASVAGVAERAGMTAANVHYYFPTKEALAAAVARQAFDRLFARLDDIDAPAERLQRFVRFHLDNHALRSGLQALAARSPEVAAELAARAEWLERTVAEVTAEPLDRQALVAVVTGLIEVAEPTPNPDRVLKHAIRRLGGTP